MQKFISTKNILNENVYSLPQRSIAEDILKKYLKKSSSSSNLFKADEKTPFNVISANTNLKQATEAPVVATNSTLGLNNDANSKIGNFSQAKKEFEKTKDVNALKELFPYLKSIQKNPDKLKKHNDLAKEFLSKAKFFMTDETLTSDIQFSSLKDTKPMNEFMANLIVTSILEVYHNKSNEVRSVLDRAEGFTIVALNREKASQPGQQNNSNLSEPGKSGPVGLYVGKENVIYLDGSAVITGLMNLAEGEGKQSEQLDVAVHEFTHALDAAKNAAKKEDGYYVDAILPGMTEKEAEIIKKAFEAAAQNETGIHEYAKTDKEEFLATAVETFIDNPGVFLKGPKELKDLYEMFKLYFDYDPMEVSKIAA